MSRKSSPSFSIVESLLLKRGTFGRCRLLFAQFLQGTNHTILILALPTLRRSVGLNRSVETNLYRLNLGVVDRLLYRVLVKLVLMDLLDDLDQAAQRLHHSANRRRLLRRWKTNAATERFGTTIQESWLFGLTPHRAPTIDEIITIAAAGR